MDFILLRCLVAEPPASPRQLSEGIEKPWRSRWSRQLVDLPALIPCIPVAGRFAPKDGPTQAYEKYGFGQLGRPPRYSSDNHEDADILTANAVTTGAYADRFALLREEHRVRYGDFDILDSAWHG